MQARVKSEHRWNIVKAFSGLEFVKSEYRDVPPQLEEEAQAHPFLETRENPPEPEIKTPEAPQEPEGANQTPPETPKAKGVKTPKEPKSKTPKEPKAKKVRTPEETAAFIERMKKAKANKNAVNSQAPEK
jgi:hypothetical protein